MNLKIEIAKVVPVGKPNNNNSTEINIKQKTVLEIQISKDNPANEQNSNIPTEIDMKDGTILENYKKQNQMFGVEPVVRFLSVNITEKKKTQCLQTICHMI